MSLNSRLESNKEEEEDDSIASLAESCPRIKMQTPDSCQNTILIFYYFKTMNVVHRVMLLLFHYRFVSLSFPFCVVAISFFVCCHYFNWLVSLEERVRPISAKEAMRGGWRLEFIISLFQPCVFKEI